MYSIIFLFIHFENYIETVFFNDKQNVENDPLKTEADCTNAGLYSDFVNLSKIGHWLV